MATKDIATTEESYERLRSRKGENQSFSDVILQNFPAKKKLSQILAEIGRDDDPANRIEAASMEMRRSKMRDAES
ncbi:MAG: antitoxin [Methanothrix sp.]|nr:antitoxin [Methanothrix sp.]